MPVLLAKQCDLTTLAALHKSVRLYTDFAIHPEYASATALSGYYEDFWRKALMKSELEANPVYKYVRCDLILGFCRFGASDPETSKSLNLSGLPGPIGELHQIYISITAQKHGIGTTLYRKACTKMRQRGFQSMLIAMYKSNPRMHQFYKKNGATYFRDDIHRTRRGKLLFELPVVIFVQNLADKRFND
jgi:ribosomal protein S18 acetylase RimI-like enzyme